MKVVLYTPYLEVVYEKSVLSINYCGYYRNFSFILNKINFLKKYFSFVIKILKFLKILNLDVYLNLYDIMFIIAKKQN